MQTLQQQDVMEPQPGHWEVARAGGAPGGPGVLAAPNARSESEPARDGGALNPESALPADEPLLEGAALCVLRTLEEPLRRLGGPLWWPGGERRRPGKPLRKLPSKLAALLLAATSAVSSSPSCTNKTMSRIDYNKFLFSTA
jgi:hypothetical protein